jgi:hypothetical protein
MSTIAIISNGTLLKFGDGASPENFTTVPEVTKLSGPAIKFDLLDATSHDSTGFFREFIPGLADGDNVAFDCNWKPSNTVHKDLRINSYARTKTNFKTIFPDSTDNTVLYATYVQTISPKADIGTILTASGTLKVTGQPAWS